MAIIVNQNKLDFKYDPTTEMWQLYGYFGRVPTDVYRRAGLLEVIEAMSEEGSIKNNSTTLTFHDKWYTIMYGVLKGCLQYARDVKMLKRRINLHGFNMALGKMNHLKEAMTQEIIDNTRPLDTEALKAFNYKPMDYQAEMFKNYKSIVASNKYRGILLDAATGTGKTYMSLCLSEMLQADTVIVICPNQTIDKVWKEGITSELFKVSRKVYDIRSTADYNKEKYIIANYEAIHKVQHLLNKIPKGNVVIIVDESHNFADIKSKRTGDLINLVDDSKTENVILLSGTPIKAYYSEMVNVLLILDGRFRGNDRPKLEKIFKSPRNVVKAIIPTIYQYSSFKIEKKEIELEPVEKIYINIEIPNGKDYTLSNILKEFRKAYDKRMKEVMDDMDDYIKIHNIGLEKIRKKYKEQDIKIYLDKFEQVRSLAEANLHMQHTDLLAEVKRYEKEYSSVLSGIDKKAWLEACVCIKYPRLKVIGECLANVVGRARINCHRDIAKHLNYVDIINSTEKDTIIFSNYIEVCEEIAKVTKSLGMEPVLIYGDETKNLRKHVTDFIEKPERNPLVTTYKSLSTGVHLTNANVIVLIDLPFRMYTYDQAIARAWRLGQDSRVTIYTPSLNTGEEPNISQRNHEILDFFRKEVEHITGMSMGVDLKGSYIDNVFEEDDESVKLASFIRKNAMFINNEDYDFSYNNESFSDNILTYLLRDRS